MSPQGSERRLGPALLVALLVASLLAGILVYRARTPDLALEVVRLDRVLGLGPEGESPGEFLFFVRFDEPDARLEIAGSGQVAVRSLAADVALAAEERIRCRWDGRDDEGRPVPPGNYRLRVVLPGQGRDMVFPLRVVLREGVRPGPAVEGPPCRTAAGETL